MSDLISRSALIEKMNDTKIQVMFDLPVEELLGEDVDMDDFCTLLQDAIQAYRKLVIGEVINKTPTVEAKPVVYGEWIESDWFEYDGRDECILHPKEAVKCTNCNHAFKKDLLWRDNFCPNCGARMVKDNE